MYNIRYICVINKRDRQGRYNTLAPRVGPLSLQGIIDDVYIMKEVSFRGNNDASPSSSPSPTYEY